MKFELLLRWKTVFRGRLRCTTAVVTALADLGLGFRDEDYGAALLGELSVALVGLKEVEQAQGIARLIWGQEKSEHLRSLAEAEVAIGEKGRARAVLQEARQAAFIYRFPTRQAQSIAAIAGTMERVDLEAAVELWESAIAIAAPAQEAGGTGGPEASGVLFEAVEALWRLARPTDARRAADQIKLESLRERANALCS